MFVFFLDTMRLLGFTVITIPLDGTSRTLFMLSTHYMKKKKRKDRVKRKYLLVILSVFYFPHFHFSFHLISHLLLSSLSHVYLLNLYIFKLSFDCLSSSSSFHWSFPDHSVLSCVLVILLCTSLFSCYCYFLISTPFISLFLSGCHECAVSQPINTNDMLHQRQEKSSHTISLSSHTLSLSFVCLRPPLFVFLPISSPFVT